MQEPSFNPDGTINQQSEFFKLWFKPLYQDMWIDGKLEKISTCYGPSDFSNAASSAAYYKSIGQEGPFEINGYEFK